MVMLVGVDASSNLVPPAASLVVLHSAIKGVKDLCN
jgi:hypothetical protein